MVYKCMRQVLNLACTLKMKSISTLTWSCFITEKPVHLEKAFEKAECATMTWKILKVSNRSPDCESPKYELKDWCFPVPRVYWKCGTGLSTFTIIVSWQVEYFTPAGLASCRTTLQNPVFYPPSMFSFSQWDFGTGLDFILKTVSMENIDWDSQHCCVFLWTCGPLNRWGVWNDWLPFWSVRIKTGDMCLVF